MDMMLLNLVECIRIKGSVNLFWGEQYPLHSVQFYPVMYIAMLNQHLSMQGLEDSDYMRPEFPPKRAFVQQAWPYTV